MSEQIKGRDEIFALLRENGVASVTAAYDGQGDSGQIDSITAFDSDNYVLNLGKIQTSIQKSTQVWDSENRGWKEIPSAGTKTLIEALDDIFYGALEKQQPGWENNDGAFGTFIVDVPTQTITWEHNSRFTEYDTTTETL